MRAVIRKRSARGEAVNVFYKKVAAPPDNRPKTVRDAVRLYGDSWRLFMDTRKGHGSEVGDSFGPDWFDASSMRLMEKGDLPRVSISDVVAGATAELADRQLPKGG